MPPTIPERWFVVMPRAGHMSFADRCPAPFPGCGPDDLPLDRAHATINNWAIPFLLAHVAGDPRALASLDPATVDDPDLRVTLRR